MTTTVAQLYVAILADVDGFREAMQEYHEGDPEMNEPTLAEQTQTLEQMRSEWRARIWAEMDDTARQMTQLMNDFEQQTGVKIQDVNLLRSDRFQKREETGNRISLDVGFI